MQLQLRSVVAFLTHGEGLGEAGECIEALSRYKNAWRLGDCSYVRSYAQHTKQHEGAAMVAILKQFYPQVSRDPLRGLHAVYQGVAQKMLASGKSPDNKEISFENFLNNDKAREVATTLVSDSQVALVGWVERWNSKRQKTRSKVSGNRKRSTATAVDETK